MLKPVLSWLDMPLGMVLSWFKKKSINQNQISPYILLDIPNPYFHTA